MKYINTLITKHGGEGKYTLLMQGDDVTVKAFSHGYPHRPGNHVNLGFQGVTLVDMTELAACILASVRKQRELEKKEEGGKLIANDEPAEDIDYEVLMGATELAERRFDAEYDQLPEYLRRELYNKAEEILRNKRINAREGKHA